MTAAKVCVLVVLLELTGMLQHTKTARGSHRRRRIFLFRRSVWNELVRQIHPGDTIVSWRLDGRRTGRCWLQQHRGRLVTLSNTLMK